LPFSNVYIVEGVERELAEKGESRVGNKKRNNSLLFINVLFFIIIILCVSCSFPGEMGQSVKLPPARIGTEGQMRISLEHIYSFEDAYRNAEVVAHIKVGDWEGENNELMLSYYKAFPITVYKGDIPENFTLLQLGTSKLSVYPLFAAGDEMLIFMQRVTEIESTDPNAFISVCSYWSFFDAAYDASGNIYYMDRYGRMGETALCERDSRWAQLLPELKSDLAKRDPFFAETEFNYRYIFSKSVMEEMFERIKGER